MSLSLNNFKTKFMKKLILLTASLITITLAAQETKSLRFGVQSSNHGNFSKLSGNSHHANARFTNNRFEGMSLGILARYDHNNHWMYETQLGFRTFGFSYSIAENYSLLNLKKTASILKTEFFSVEIPLLVYYKFNPNCKNNRWLVGAGFVANLTEAKTVDKFFEKSNEGSNSSNYLSSSSTSKASAISMLRFSLGREKLFKNGGFLNINLLLNVGLNTIAKSSVNYLIDGENYNHEFTNSGNFVGLRLAYFFKSRLSIH